MGHIVKRQQFIPQLNKERTLRIYLPTGYDTSDQSYPVVYMHDAQNLFELESSGYGMIWDIKTTMESFEDQGLTKGFIVVGIDNGEGYDRLDEYCPWVNTTLKETMPRFAGSNQDFGGLGVAYGDYLVHTLKPWMDTNYRTLVGPETTSIIGSSMGGLISLNMGATYPEVYGKIGAFSTAAWFAEDELVDCLSNTDPNLWIYLDVGTNETSNPEVKEFGNIYVNGTKRVYETLKSAGIPENHMRLVIEEGAVHNELAWARRFPEAFKWLYQL